MESIKTYTILNALPDDYKKISKFFVNVKTSHFGRHRRKDSLEELFFRDNVIYRLIIPLDASKHIIIGYAEVSNTPNLPALTGDTWLDYIHFHYCCNFPFTPTNTCILTKFVYHNDYGGEILQQLLKEIFYRDNKLKYILVMESPDYRLYELKDIRNASCLEGISLIFYPKCFSITTNRKPPKLHVIKRDQILPEIRYRKAIPEDNDDLVDIVNQDNPRLKATLGEYYIAEELLAETENLLIVAEINNLTAGFIWLSDQINLQSLLENLNLQSFGNLLKVNVEEKCNEQILLVKTALRRHFEDLFTTEAIQQIFLCASEVTITDSASKISLLSCKLDTVDDCAIQNLRKLRSEKQEESSSSTVEKCFEELNEKLKSSSYYIQIQTRQLNIYKNISDDQEWNARKNVFSIQLLGLLNSFDEREAFPFLLTAFAAYPDKDYCLLEISADKPATPVILELLKYFIPLIFRPNYFGDEYYFLTHRSAVLGDISLYAARPKDAEDIIGFLKQNEERAFPFPPKRHCVSPHSTIDSRFTLKTMFSYESLSSGEFNINRYDLRPINDILLDIFENPVSEYKCFTIRCGDSTQSIDKNKIVGFVIIRFSKFLRKHFHTTKKDEFQRFFDAEIICLKLHMFFHCQSEFIFRELSRQTNFSYFYYLQKTNRYNNPNDLVINMEPLEPRRIKKVWFDCWLKSSLVAEAGFNADNDQEKHVLKNILDLLIDNYAVFMTNLRPIAYFGSTRNIVILGYTDICKAFLRLMIFSWHDLNINTRAAINCLPQVNITVICSPGGMEADHEYSFQCKTCPAETNENCWVNFKNSDAFIRNVCDRMDVTNWIKFINGKVKTIDGEQHLVTMQTECEIYYETLLLMCGTEFGVPNKIFKPAQSPHNYCHINNRFDKIFFYHKLEILHNHLTTSNEKSFIVYGSHVRTFEFIDFLLQHGVKGSEIHLVLPSSKQKQHMGLMLNISSEDARIEEILLEMVGDLGVNMYDQMTLSYYELCKNGTNLKEVTFKKFPNNAEITIKCDFFISFYEVFLPESVLEIFMDAGIETANDYVLVDENYSTSLKDVYAMGNFIKHKTEPNHQYRFVDPQEAAEKIINLLQLCKKDSCEKKYSKSSYFQAQLPMEFLMIKVTTPKRYLANHLDNEYGFSMVTYYEGEFSRIRLNDRGMVEEIVVVTKKRKSYDFLKFFCGKHELMLNNLRSRWYLKEIFSFIDFFQEPWTELLMHDDFESLKSLTKNMVYQTAQQIVQKDIDREDKRKLLYGHCQDLGITSEMEYAFLEFIRSNREDFFADIALPDDFTRDNEDKI